jgi:hypothetical protein
MLTFAREDHPCLCNHRYLHTGGVFYHGLFLLQGRRIGEEQFHFSIQKLIESAFELQ